MLDREEVFNYIYNKEIPLNFKLDGNNYFICILSETFKTHTHFEQQSDWYFPNYTKFPNLYKNKTQEIVVSNGYNVIPFRSKKDTIDECLSDFLFWFEINKSRCTNIKYYEQQ